MNFLTSEEDFKLEKLQILYFYASWIPFNKKMILMLNKIEEQNKDIEFLAIDIDTFKNFIVRFGLESLPTIILYKNGEEKKRIIGLVLTSAFRNAVNQTYKDGEKNEKRNEDSASNKENS